MRIATLDLETDPFLHGRVPAPFAAGFYDGRDYVQTWGDRCIREMLQKIRDYKKPLVIFAHNGGKFDFWYLSDAIGEPVLFIDSRLVKANLFHHEIRDSYKIIPVPLGSIGKVDIDYRKMERKVREKHKDEISHYLKVDCVDLYDAVSKFIMQFGDVLTIGGAALKELKKEYKIPGITPFEDSIYRQYFHGGRCEIFEVGELSSSKGFKLYDVNSLYPFCMATFQHPVGAADFVCSDLPDTPFYLARICAHSKGALPVRTKDGLSFPHGHVESFCTSHEIRMAQELGLIKITQVIECHAWNETTTFERFVTKFDKAKIAAEKAGDITGRTFNKLIENNAYGKTAQNPERFKNYRLFDSEKECLAAGMEIDGYLGGRVIGAEPTPINPRAYKNVAIAASVTGAGRSVFMHAWAAADRTVAGDTDSNWCERLPLELDAHKLGAWKLEAEADKLYVAAKKFYAAWRAEYDNPDHPERTKDKWIEGFYTIKKGKRVPLKSASKGVQMKPEDIARVARGEVLTMPLEAPSLRVGREAKFIARRIARSQLAS